jgi:hypothetical protein
MVVNGKRSYMDAMVGKEYAPEIGSDGVLWEFRCHIR